MVRRQLGAYVSRLSKSVGCHLAPLTTLNITSRTSCQGPLYPCVDCRGKNDERRRGAENSKESQQFYSQTQMANFLSQIQKASKRSELPKGADRQSRGKNKANGNSGWCCRKGWTESERNDGTIFICERGLESTAKDSAWMMFVTRARS